MSYKKLLVYSDMSCHYEIIESVIVKYQEIIRTKEKCDISIFFDFDITIDTISFKRYILKSIQRLVLKDAFKIMTML